VALANDVIAVIIIYLLIKHCNRCKAYEQDKKEQRALTFAPNNIILQTLTVYGIIKLVSK